MAEGSGCGVGVELSGLRISGVDIRVWGLTIGLHSIGVGLPRIKSEAAKLSRKPDHPKAYTVSSTAEKSYAASAPTRNAILIRTAESRKHKACTSRT